ncbi:MAG: FAD/NAD(P)-binding protein [bacterium]
MMNSKKEQNPYLPIPVIIDRIRIENEAKDLKTVRLVFLNKEDAQCFSYKCGQFAMISIPHAGEIPIGIASSPLDEGYLEFTIKKYPTGTVTFALHNCEQGAQIGVRGPYGNAFPLQEAEGKNIVIVGGGFAFTTLRSTIRYLLHKENRPLFNKNITVLYGARSPGELLYKSELEQWSNRDDISLHVTVDKGDEDWKGKEGFVPSVLKEIGPSADNAIALVCGPPIMLKFTLPVLSELGFDDEQIITSLERRMSCGIGKCGRCAIGPHFICKDGPIFTLKEIKQMPEQVV